eukprot:g9162.t1
MKNTDPRHEEEEDGIGKEFEPGREKDTFGVREFNFFRMAYMRLIEEGFTYGLFNAYREGNKKYDVKEDSNLVEKQLQRLQLIRLWMGDPEVWVALENEDERTREVGQGAESDCFRYSKIPIHRRGLIIEVVKDFIKEVKADHPDRIKLEAALRNAIRPISVLARFESCENRAGRQVLKYEAEGVELVRQLVWPRVQAKFRSERQQWKRLEEGVGVKRDAQIASTESPMPNLSHVPGTRDDPREKFSNEVLGHLHREFLSEHVEIQEEKTRQQDEDDYRELLSSLDTSHLQRSFVVVARLLQHMIRALGSGFDFSRNTFSDFSRNTETCCRWVKFLGRGLSRYTSLRAVGEPDEAAESAAFQDKLFHFWTHILTQAQRFGVPSELEESFSIRQTEAMMYALDFNLQRIVAELHIHGRGVIFQTATELGFSHSARYPKAEHIFETVRQQEKSACRMLEWFRPWLRDRLEAFEWIASLAHGGSDTRYDAAPDAHPSGGGEAAMTSAPSFSILSHWGMQGQLEGLRRFQKDPDKVVAYVRHEFLGIDDTLPPPHASIVGMENLWGWTRAVGMESNCGRGIPGKHLATAAAACQDVLAERVISAEDSAARRAELQACRKRVFQKVKECIDSHIVVARGKDELCVYVEIQEPQETKARLEIFERCQGDLARLEESIRLKKQGPERLKILECSAAVNFETDTPAPGHLPKFAAELNQASEDDKKLYADMVCLKNELEELPGDQQKVEANRKRCEQDLVEYFRSEGYAVREHRNLVYCGWTLIVAWVPDLDAAPPEPDVDKLRLRAETVTKSLLDSRIEDHQLKEDQYFETIAPESCVEAYKNLLSCHEYVDWDPHQTFKHKLEKSLAQFKQNLGVHRRASH